ARASVRGTRANAAESSVTFAPSIVMTMARPSVVASLLRAFTGSADASSGFGGMISTLPPADAEGIGWRSSVCAIAVAQAASKTIESVMSFMAVPSIAGAVDASNDLVGHRLAR